MSHNTDYTQHNEKRDKARKLIKATPRLREMMPNSGHMVGATLYAALLAHGYAWNIQTKQWQELANGKGGQVVAQAVANVQAGKHHRMTLRVECHESEEETIRALLPDLFDLIDYTITHVSKHYPAFRNPGFMRVYFELEYQGNG